MLPLVVLVLLTGALVLQIRVLESSAAWLDHTDVVIAKMHGLQRLMIDEETGIRGYLLTSRTEFLEPYNQARNEIGGRFAELRNLVGDNPEQIALLQRLQQEYGEWLSGATQKLDQSQPQSRDLLVSGALESKHRMDHIRLLVSQFIEHENVLRARRSSRKAFLSDATLFVLAVAVVTAGVAIYLGVRSLRRSREALRVLTLRQSVDEKALRESEGRYRMLFDSIDEGFCIVEVIFDSNNKALDYRFLETNPSFAKQTGLANVNGRTMRELSPAHEEAWFETYGRVALTGEAVRFENRAEQLHRWYDVYAFRIAQPEQHKVAILFQDVSVRKHYEAALRESEDRFRRIYERAPVGIEQVGPDGRLLLVNSTLCTMLGYTEAELLTKTFEQITHPDDRATEAALLRRMFSGERESYSLEKRYLRKNGNPVWVSITSTAVRNAPYALEYRITVVEDITARKCAEQALIRAEKLAVTGRMAAVMAHEINNPLGAALNSLYLAGLDRNMSPKTCEQLEIAERELGRVAHITRQTLGFYRETGTPIKVDISILADEVVDLFAPKLRNKDIDVERQYRSGEEVYAIEGELRQILSNLIGNSIDAVDHNGRIRLAVAGPFMLEGTRPALRFSVADNGAGIQPQHMKQIFEPFFSTKENTGTGLGLWVTRQLVKKHDGKIRVRSRLGVGTVFHVFLPIERRTLKRLSQDLDQDLQATA